MKWYGIFSLILGFCVIGLMSVNAAQASQEEMRFIVKELEQAFNLLKDVIISLQNSAQTRMGDKEDPHLLLAFIPVLNSLSSVCEQAINLTSSNSGDEKVMEEINASIDDVKRRTGYLRYLSHIRRPTPLGLWHAIADLAVALESCCGNIQTGLFNMESRVDGLRTSFISSFAMLDSEENSIAGKIDTAQTKSEQAKSDVDTFCIPLA